MSSNILELAIIAFIVIGMGVAVWKGGSRNPVGTGGLAKALGHMDSEFKGLRGKVGEIEKQVVDIDRRAASKSDIERLEKQMADHARATAAIDKGLSRLSGNISSLTAKIDATGRTVDRIMDHIVEKGMR